MLMSIGDEEAPALSVVAGGIINRVSTAAVRAQDAYI